MQVGSRTHRPADYTFGSTPTRPAAYSFTRLRGGTFSPTAWSCFRRRARRRLYDAATGEETAPPSRRTAAGAGRRFQARHGKRLASGSSGHRRCSCGTQATGQEAFTLHSRPDPSSIAVAFSPDGRRIASCSEILIPWVNPAGHPDRRGSWASSSSDTASGQEVAHFLQQHPTLVDDVQSKTAGGLSWMKMSRRPMGRRRQPRWVRFDAVSGKEEDRFHPDDSQLPTFSPDGTLVAIQNTDSTFAMFVRVRTVVLSTRGSAPTATGTGPSPRETGGQPRESSYSPMGREQAGGRSVPTTVCSSVGANSGTPRPAAGWAVPTSWARHPVQLARANGSPTSSRSAPGVGGSRWATRTALSRLGTRPTASHCSPSRRPRGGDSGRVQSQRPVARGRRPQRVGPPLGRRLESMSGLDKLTAGVGAQRSSPTRTSEPSAWWQSHTSLRC